MHQIPRHSPRTSSPATSPKTNPTRTNNPIDPIAPSARPLPDTESVGQDSSRGTGKAVERAEGGPSRDSVKKLDQIIQNVFSKAGTIILQERMRVTPTLVGRALEKRTSRWFQLDTDDIDDFREAFRVWKQCGGFEHRPSPLVIETYLDASRLKSGQSLVIQDENGKRWDVLEALNSSDLSSDSSSGGGQGKPKTHVLLERWQVELKGAAPDDPEDFGLLLPTIYKKAIVLMRSIYTTTGVLPAWKLARNSKTKGTHPALSVRCQVSAGGAPSYGSDALRIPLFEGRGDVTTDFMFGSLEVPVGRFYVSASYRNHCNFQVVETESLLSSRIGMAISDDMFKPSLPRRELARPTEVGSLPYHLRHDNNATENSQRYGSLSTFHGEGPLGTSPISALRAVKAPGSDASSPPDSRPASVEVPPHSLPIQGPPRRPSLRVADGSSRRPSVSFQSSPFKQGSLSGSPVPPSPQSYTRTSVLTHARNRSSLTAGMPASLRGGPPPPPPPATDSSTVVGSPRPSATNRFSSSFTHRRNRPSFGGTSRVDDDQNSSGKQSLSSSVAQPGSGLLNEAGAGGSSGSFQTDDDNLQDFLKVLESKKTLQSFEPSKTSESATKRTSAQLSKFHLMRESNNALTESLNSSMQLQRSSSSSSRQLANVPGMSTSSSPGKPLSPHTPHTPAVPSRLSENSSVNYTAPIRTTSRARHDSSDITEEPSASAPVTLEGTSAIPIPVSPRPFAHARRSNSVAHQARVLVDEDDDDVDVRRSVSLGAEEGDVPSLSTLLLRRARDEGDRAGDESPTVLQPPAVIRATTSSEELLAGASSSAEREVRPPGGLFSTRLSSSPYGRGRYGGRGVTPPHSGSGSLAGSGRYGYGGRGHNSRGGLLGTGSGGQGGGGSTDEADDELLLFDMSEINREQQQQQSRRSIEEARGGYDSSGRGSRRW